MSRRLVEYRVFIGSPGDVVRDRLRFRNALHDYTEKEADPRGVRFRPVSWDKLPLPFGHPWQDSIDDDLKLCDYAVFVWHNRWGSPSGRSDHSRTEEEWLLAKSQHAESKMRDIALFFKEHDRPKNAEMEADIAKIEKFKEEVRRENTCRIMDYKRDVQFTDLVTDCLREWLRTLERGTKPGSIERRLESARMLVEKGRTHSQSGRSVHALSAFGRVVSRYGNDRQPLVRELVAKVRIQMALILNRLGRIEEELRIYDDISRSLEDATELFLVELRNQASQFKKQTLGELPDEGDESEVSETAPSANAVDEAVGTQAASSLHN